MLLALMANPLSTIDAFIPGLVRITILTDADYVSFTGWQAVWLSEGNCKDSLMGSRALHPDCNATVLYEDNFFGIKCIYFIKKELYQVMLVLWISGFGGEVSGAD